jgi:hypothetical protein
MNQYKLVNKDRGEEVLAIMKEAAWIYELQIGNSEIIKSDVETFEYDMEIIRTQQLISSDNSLNDFLHDDYLSFREAVFCLVGINPNTVIALDRDTMSPDDRAGILVYQTVKESREYRKLSRAPQVGQKDGFISKTEDKVYTKGFIRWAIEKGLFIEVSDNKTIHKIGPEERNYSKKFSKELHKQLTKNNLISGEFDEIWTWLVPQNALALLADKLSMKFPKECPPSRKQLNLLAYIKNPGKSPLNKTVPSNNGPIIQKIDSVIHKLRKNYT